MAPALRRLPGRVVRVTPAEQPDAAAAEQAAVAGGAEWRTRRQKAEPRARGIGADPPSAGSVALTSSAAQARSTASAAAAARSTRPRGARPAQASWSTKSNEPPADAAAAAALHNTDALSDGRGGDNDDECHEAWDHEENCAPPMCVNMSWTVSMLVVCYCSTR